MIAAVFIMPVCLSVPRHLTNKGVEGRKEEGEREGPTFTLSFTDSQIRKWLLAGKLKLVLEVLALSC